MQLNGSGAGRGTGKGATPTITGDRHGSSVIYRSGPLVGVKNSPSAPPPTGREALCRRRRRSDALLVLLGGLICLVPALHLSWHAGHVPRPYRAPSGQAGHLGGAVQARLDGFARGTGAARAKATKGGRIKGAPAEGKTAEGATAKGATPGKATKGGRPTDRRSSGGQRRGNQPHPVAHLDCADHGGPHEREAVDEMVFWSDIPSDASYLSPMHPLNDPRTPDDVERFLTFEPDHGGWNNIRMAMETALVLSHAMGRTLVLPPEQTMYLLNKGGKAFGFSDFFHLDAIAIEHRGFQVITTAEFLARMGKTGRLRHKATGRVAYPPGNTTNYDGRAAQPLRNYLRTVGVMPGWDPWKCALAVPSSTESGAIKELKTTAKRIMDGSYGKPKPTLEEFNGRPTPVNASLAERMREMLADRDQLCIYDHALQKAPLIHLAVDGGSRLLTHFYAFVFFADWRQDLWSKRFVRDHLRYVDEIVCAAARVVQAVRQHARANKRHKDSQEMGTYDAMHVRRGDFQYPPTQLPAEKLYELSKGELTEGATLYIATDEKSKQFFHIFRQHYDVVFLDDFISKAIAGVNPNYYGMIDQLVAYKSRVFYGTWWSTLSGYVNRMRGYYIAKHRLEGHKDGTMKSWYFTPPERVLQMRSYIPVRKPIYCREFPVSWRDIDHDVEEIQEGETKTGEEERKREKKT